MTFEWDANKAKSNLEKHQVSFDEATTVFYDPDHSEDEDRYLIVGRANTGNLLIVSYTEREDLIRIISARKLTKFERKMYEEG